MPSGFKSPLADQQSAGLVAGVSGGVSGLVAYGCDAEGFLRGEPDYGEVGVVAAGGGEDAASGARAHGDAPAAGVLAGGIGTLESLVGFRLEERGLAAGSAQMVGSEAGLIR